MRCRRCVVRADSGRPQPSQEDRPFETGWCRTGTLLRDRLRPCRFRSSFSPRRNRNRNRYKLHPHPEEHREAMRLEGRGRGISTRKLMGLHPSRRVAEPVIGPRSARTRWRRSSEPAPGLDPGDEGTIWCSSSGCREAEIVQLGEPAFARMAVDRRKTSRASAWRPCCL
jgi:hypothetical protein